MVKKWGRLSEKEEQKRGYMHSIFRKISINYVSPIVAKFMNANQVTVFNLVVISSLAGFCFYLSQFYIYPMIGCSLLIIRSFIDRVDGDVATIRGEYSPIGGLLDDVTDRISVMIIYFGFTLGTYNQNNNPAALFWGIFGMFGIGVNSCLVLLDKNRYIKFMSFIKKIFFLPYFLMIPAAIIRSFLPFLILISIFANLRAVILFIDYFFSRKKKGIIGSMV